MTETKEKQNLYSILKHFFDSMPRWLRKIIAPILLLGTVVLAYFYLTDKKIPVSPSNPCAGIYTVRGSIVKVKDGQQSYVEGAEVHLGNEVSNDFSDDKGTFVFRHFPISEDSTDIQFQILKNNKVLYRQWLPIRQIVQKTNRCEINLNNIYIQDTTHDKAPAPPRAFSINIHHNRLQLAIARYSGIPYASSGTIAIRITHTGDLEKVSDNLYAYHAGQLIAYIQNASCPLGYELEGTLPAGNDKSFVLFSINEQIEALLAQHTDVIAKKIAQCIEQ